MNSMSTILVISPDHLESSYCSFEKNMAMELMHERKGMFVINFTYWLQITFMWIVTGATYGAGNAHSFRNT